MHLVPVAQGEARSMPKRKILTSQDGKDKDHGMVWATQ